MTKRGRRWWKLEIVIWFWRFLRTTTDNKNHHFDDDDEDDNDDDDDDDDDVDEASDYEQVIDGAINLKGRRKSDPLKLGKKTPHVKSNFRDKKADFYARPTWGEKRTSVTRARALLAPRSSRVQKCTLARVACALFRRAVVMLFEDERLYWNWIEPKPQRIGFIIANNKNELISNMLTFAVRSRSVDWILFWLLGNKRRSNESLPPPLGSVIDKLSSSSSRWCSCFRRRVWALPNAKAPSATTSTKDTRYGCAWESPLMHLKRSKPNSISA